VRGFFSGAVIAMTVILARVLGPVFGGVVAAFPAILLLTLAINLYHHGKEFSAAVIKALIPGAISFVVFGAAVRYSYVPFGIWIGTIVSVCCALASSIVVYNLFGRRMK